MPWYFPWSESIKKRACRYLLQHYLGDFLKEKLDLDQLTVDLYNGKGTVTNVPLDVWSLNEMLGNSGVPLELIDGFISSISVSVPWKALLSDSCEIEIHGLNLTFAPKQNAAEGSLIDSTYSWSSMTTSMQLAQECLRQEHVDEVHASQSFEGLEAFAQTIESVLARVRLSFVDTVIRMEHIPLDATTGVGIELHIDRIDYWDLSHEEVGQENSPQHSVYEPVAIAIKNFQMMGINIFVEEFPRHKRTRLREVIPAADDDVLIKGFQDPITSAAQGLYVNRNSSSDQNCFPGLLPKVKVLSSCGKQNLKVKLKQNEELPGPKIDIDYSLAGLNIFITPRQLHLVIDALTAILESTGSSHGEQQNNGNPSFRSKMREMKNEDYMKVEESLQNQFHSIESSSWKQTLDSLKSVGHTSSSSLGHPSNGSEEEEFFSMTDFPLPALGQPTLLNTMKQHNISSNVALEAVSFSPTSPRSTLSNISLGGSSGSLSTKGTLTERASTVFRASSAGSSGPKFSHGFVSPQNNTNVGLAGVSALDESVDSTHIKLRSSNIVFVLLHRDPLMSNIDTTAFSEKKDCLKEMAEKFFSNINQYTRQSLFGIDSENLHENMLSLCCYDHIRVLASAVTLETEQKNTSAVKSATVDVIFGKVAVDENLYDDVINKKEKKPYSNSKIVSFNLKEESPLYPGMFSSSLSPCVKMKYLKTQRCNTSGVQSRSAVPSKSSITIDFGVMDTELDLTIVDRIVAIIWPGPLYKLNAPLHQSFNNMYNSLATGRSSNQNTAYHQVIDDSPFINDVKTDLTFRFPKLNILLRFPVPDLRPASDIDKRPWWRKAVHKENLRIDIESCELKTTFHGVESSSTYDITFKKAKGYFLALNSRYHLFNIDCSSDSNEHASMTIDMPRILITTSAPVQSVFDELNEGSKDSSPDSIEEQFPWMNAEPSPFSTQQTMYENEEMLLPGSIAEMNAFQEFATMCSKLAINCYFPEAQVNLHTNDVFELFYNRVFGDLIMWEPSAPSPFDPNSKQMNPYESVHINLASHIGQLETGGDKFFMCRSGIRDGLNSTDSSFFSNDFFDTPIKHQEEQTNLCFSLHINHGQIALFPPCKDIVSDFAESPTPTDENCIDENEIVNTAHVIVNFKDGHFFTASGYKGQPTVDFIELYTNSIELFHSDCISSAIDLNIMEDALSVSSLVKTIYSSEENVQVKCKASAGLGTENVAMLSLAMKCVAETNTKRKDNKLSVAIRGGTLFHRTLTSGHSWLVQLMDFMEIKDYPIIGYSFPSTVTSLHCHLWGCAVDYRPLYLPIHSLLTVEGFSLSSNLTPGSSTSILRFLVEDSTFYILDKTNKQDGDFCDYVAVMDMGMFELSLKITDGLDIRQPVIDLAMSNNILNIHTCSDSCIALMKLIKYFASDGDLRNQELTEEDIDKSVDLDTTLPSRSVGDGEILHDDHHIDSLMADAMQDEECGIVDEKFSGTLIDQCLEDDFNEEAYSSSDEYCFLDNETSDRDREDHEPIIRTLTSNPIFLIDDYFQTPLGRHDQLGSPDDFPLATYRYTIREMSIVWQMYGGNDFESEVKSYSSPKEPFIRNSDNFPRPAEKIKSHKKPYQVKGGVNRDLDTLIELQMNKVRFQHEIYPDHANQIYRDVLLIYDLEIRDRLTSSQINKFLYRYSSESLPKQSSANMVTLKLLVTKPEDEARSEEATVRVSLQPLRLNIDQDSLFFLKDFFSEISGSKPSRRASSVTDLPACLPACLSSSPGREPFQTISEPISGSPNKSESSRLVSRMETTPRQSETLTHTISSESIKIDKSDVLFIKTFVFSPEVPIRLDYHGKHVAIEQGTLTGLIIGLSQLNCSELRLKRLCCRSGLLGTDKLINYFLQEWLNDIKQNQLQSILGGVGPAYSFLQLYQGIKDLFWMPVQQYRQDGRIVRGLQRGAHSFSTSTAMAVLELSNRLVSTIQSLAEFTFDMVSSGPSHVSSLQGRNSVQAAHPAELREGVANAYTVLSEGLSQTASNIVRVAAEEHEKKGVTGAVGGVLRQIPPTVVKPFILATEATSNVLGGAMNQLAPDKRREALEKWKSDTT